MQLIIGCGGLIYTSDPGAPAASLLESKITSNSTILTPGAQFFCAHIKVFLNNPMACCEYMKIPLSWFPQDIIDRYKIMDLVDKDNFVFVDIRKGMYGLNQSARIAFDRLLKLMKPRGYHPLRSNLGIWCH